MRLLGLGGTGIDLAFVVSESTPYQTAGTLNCLTATPSPCCFLDSSGTVTSGTVTEPQEQSEKEGPQEKRNEQHNDIWSLNLRAEENLQTESTLDLRVQERHMSNG